MESRTLPIMNRRRFSRPMIVTALAGLMAGPVSGQTAPPAASQPADGAKPIIRAIESVHDFGPIIEGRALRHAFKVQNAGTAPLQIAHVGVSCGCMTAGNYPNVLPAGETGEFPFTLDTTKMLGPFIKTLTIESDDPVTPVMTLMVRGEGRRLIEVMPQSAGFGRIIEEQTREQILTITSRAEQPMTAAIGSLAKAGKFEFDLVESVPGVEFKLFVVLRPPYREGTLSGSVTINTNIEAQKSLEISASAVILPQVEVVPNSLFLGDMQAGSPTSGKASMKPIEFYNRGSKPVRLLEATVDDPALKITSKEVEPGRVYRLLLSAPAGYKPPHEGRTVTLKTDDASRPTFQVPLRLAGGITQRSNPATPASQTTTAQAEPPRKPVMELVGKSAPTFALSTTHGLPVGSSEFRSYPATVLNFIAPNCPFCKKQIPTIEKVRQEYEARGVRFVNLGETLHGKAFTPQEAMGVMDQLGAHLELAMDPDNKVGNQFKVTSFPILVLVGKDSGVVDAWPGARSDIPDKLKSRLEDLLRAEMTGTKPAIKN